MSQNLLKQVKQKENKVAQTSLVIEAPKAQLPVQRRRKPNPVRPSINMRVRTVENQLDAIHDTVKVIQMTLNKMARIEENPEWVYEEFEPEPLVLTSEDRIKTYQACQQAIVEYESQTVCQNYSALGDPLGAADHDPNSEIDIMAEPKAKAALLGTPEFLEELRNLPQVNGPFQMDVNPEDCLEFEEKIVDKPDAQLLAMFKNYFSTGQLRTLPIVYNRFPIVEEGNVVTLGMVIRSMAPLMSRGAPFNYVSFMIGKKTVNVAGPTYVPFEDCVNAFIKMAGDCMSVLPDTCFLTVLSEKPFDEYSWMACAACTMRGLVINGIVTGAIIGPAAFCPAKVDKKLEFAKKQRQILFVASDIDDLAVDAWQANWMLVRDCEFTFEGKVLNPMPCETLSTMVLASFLAARSSEHEFRLKPAAEPGALFPELENQPMQMKQVKPSPYSEPEDLKSLYQRFQQLEEKGIENDWPMTKDITIKRIQIEEGISGKEKLLKTQAERLEKTLKGSIENLNQFIKAGGKREKGVTSTQSKYLTAEQNRNLKGAERQRYIARGKKHGGPVTGPLVPNLAPPKVKETVVVSKFAKYVPQQGMKKVEQKRQAPPQKLLPEDEEEDVLSNF